ncbi:putative calcium-transporting ATPase 13, plasma membrane-type [Coffea eugenioides]|uniref:putative calcium-transporting ATPase 13, plasma membrane-type n=1 Tax=Coffea eugenioides TaxID=49369 RepID=UPI000F60D0C4|nr:putative calcium-transporting ATPase 13, plasma membrane-type [Coffea eugenioides]
MLSSSTTPPKKGNRNLNKKNLKHSLRFVFFLSVLAAVSYRISSTVTVSSFSSSFSSSMYPLPPKSNRTQKRLQIVFRAIYFAVSLSKKAVNTNALLFPSVLHHNPSYVAIDVQPSKNDRLERSFMEIDRKALADLVREKNSDRLHTYGGAKELAAILQTDPEAGISSAEGSIKQRIDAFGSNTYRKPPAKSLLRFLLEASKDSMIIILLVCAVLSLCFGIKQNGLKEGWYDGASIIVAVILVLGVSAISNFKQSKQFEKLSNESNNIRIVVVRDGRRQQMSIFKIVVGDIVCLKIGDQIPADGLFLDGYSLKVDESSMTGESDHVEIHEAGNPFLLSGTKVTDGYGRMLVTSVGMNTTWGQMMSLITHDTNEQTPLQRRLNKLTSGIGKVGLLVAFLVLVVLLIRYFTGQTKDERGQREFKARQTSTGDIMNSIIRIIAAAVTILVVAIPEGLPLAVTLTLAYSMKQMVMDHAMVRKLSACETMGSATTICTDKTGTLTLNQMQVTEFWLGNEPMKGKTPTDIAPDVGQLLQESIGLNSTGEIYTSPSSPNPEITGNPTESAILNWAVFDMKMDINTTKQEYEKLHVEVFNSEKKRSGVLVRKNHSETVRVHWKGAAEMILARCSNYYMENGTVKAIDDEERKQLEIIIEKMAGKSLRCIAFAFKSIAGHGVICENLPDTQLTLLGLVGLKDPCRPEVKAAVKSCRKAGVNIKVITGDNMLTAKSIAIECGILNGNEDLEDTAVEGITFRNYSPEERMAKIDRILLMARSSPFDKLLMVQSLKQKGHVVAVTGDGTNDAPALKEADVGLSMGIQGTEVAKESSDVVILDDNFNTVVMVLRWGRCVYRNIQKFIQFQLTVNITALCINFIAAVSAGEVPLTAVQLLWVNLIMDTLGALALATEQPNNDLMECRPVGRREPLITKIMWRNLIAQALYQVTIILILEFKGSSIFHVNEKVEHTIIFNSFVLCQVFNEFNARELEKKNVFRGVLKNKLFLSIIGMTVALQVVMVEFLKRFATTERLNWVQWVSCIGIAALSWPIGWFVKCIPSERLPSLPFRTTF